MSAIVIDASSRFPVVRNHVWVGVSDAQIEKVIAEDVAFLDAHPTRSGGRKKKEFG